MVFNWSVNQSNLIYNVAQVNQKHFGDARMRERRLTDGQTNRKTDRHIYRQIDSRLAASISGNLGKPATER